MLVRIVGLGMLSAVLMSVAIGQERLWPLGVGLVVWWAGLVGAGLTLRPSRPGRRNHLWRTGVLCVGAAAVFVVGMAAAATAVREADVITLLVGPAAVGVGAVVILMGRLLLPHREPAPAAPSSKLRVAGAVTAVLVVAAAASVAPFMVHDRLRAAAAARAVRCEDLAPFARGAHLELARRLDAACRLQRSGPVATSTSGPTPLRLFGSAADDDAVLERTAAAYESHRRLLGDPRPEGVDIYSLAMFDRIRGMAGRGYLLIEERELAQADDCTEFRASAGVHGRCAAWVLAHEAGHQWFHWTAHNGSIAGAALSEGTSDYLAWRWWREEFGAAEADRLAVELFDGRMALDRRFARAHPPALEAPAFMNDAQGRSRAYGRGSGAWIAVERAVGPDRAGEALRAVFDSGRDARPSIEEVLTAVAAAVPEAEPVLRTWWTDRSFQPHL